MSSTPSDPAAQVLADCLARVHEAVPETVQDLDAAQLRWRPDADANPIGWLVWHLARVQDDHVAGVAEALGRPVEQAWSTWRERFDLPYAAEDIGYGHSTEDVAAFDADPDLLLGYLDAVHERTTEVLGRLSERELETVVDELDGEPVTAQARLVSVIGDTTQHLGQAAYVRGLLERRD